jgi:hypothetical protein
MKKELRKSDAIIINPDFTALKKANKQQRLSAATDLFLWLTKALENGFDVDISNPKEIIVQKKSAVKRQLE